jgi:hypothetical protein
MSFLRIFHSLFFSEFQEIKFLKLDEILSNFK